WQRLVLLTRLSDSPDPAAAPRAVITRPVGFDFFDVLGIELLAGRTYSPERDDDARIAASPQDGEAPPANVVVDRALAEQCFGTPDEAVGGLLYFPADML